MEGALKSPDFTTQDKTLIMKPILGLLIRRRIPDAPSNMCIATSPTCDICKSELQVCNWYQVEVHDIWSNQVHNFKAKIMTKEKDGKKKQDKKPALKNLKEKRAAKEAKRKEKRSHD